MSERLPPPTGVAEKQMAMRLSLVIGVVLLVLKATAWQITGSSAILSDTAESVAHLVAVGFACYSLWLSLKPADPNHLYGHAKISFFSAGVEGALIAVAAGYIILTAVLEILRGPELEQLGIGLALTAFTAVVNALLGWHLVRTGRQRGSIILEANGHHVLTDCWTSLGVLLALSLVWLTGWTYWDPLFAILAALNILRSGSSLVRRSIGGLMDASDPVLQARLHDLLTAEAGRHGISYHNLRHRNVGDAYVIEVHLVFPATTPIREAHSTATLIEQAVEAAIKPAAQVITHLEGDDEEHPPARD